MDEDGYAKDANSCPGSSQCKDGNRTTVEQRIQPYVDNYKSQYEAKLAEIKNQIRLYNSCTGTVTNSVDTSLNVTGWDNKMVEWSDANGPEIYLNYKEDYIKKDFNTKLDANYSGITNTTETYCFGDTDSTYRCVSGGSASSSSNATVGTNVVYCDDSTCTTKVIQVGKSNWIQKTKTQMASYNPNNDFSVRTQYGTVKFKEPACNGNDCLYTKLPNNAIPVSLLRETGVYPFVLSYSNVGQYNVDNHLGRLVNKSGNTVLEAYNSKVSSKEKDYQSCKANTMQQSAGYVCHYLTNCDTCEFRCDPDGQCYFEDCEDGNCKFQCKNCIFDGNNNTYSFRTVSLNSLFPNERDKNDAGSYNWTNEFKGKITRNIIENGYSRLNIPGGDEIYTTPEYSVKLTAMNLKNLKDYNKEVGSFTNDTIPDKYTKFTKNSGSRKNSSLYCTNITLNGLNYSVKCNSSFLDIVENETSHKYASSITRPDKDKRFTLFTELVDADPDLKSKCADYRCINRTNAIGPSWK